MKGVKEILNGDKRVWFLVEDKDFKSFLKFARDNGCKWLNGDEILVDNDHISHHMSINSANQIAFVPVWAWFALAQNPTRKILFSEVLGGEYDKNKRI